MSTKLLPAFRSLALLASVMTGLLALAAPAEAQNRLSVYAPGKIIADPNFSYVVVVQLQNAAGQPAHASAPFTITLRSSNPSAIRIYGDPHLQVHPPSGDFKGDTYVVGHVVAAGRKSQGGVTITASAPGFADGTATIGETIPWPQSGAKWPAAKTVRPILMPPVVVAGEKGPMVLYEVLDQSGRPTADPSSTTGAGYVDARLLSSNPSVFPNGILRRLSHWDYGGMANLDTSPPVAAGQATLTVQLTGRPNIAGGSAPLTVVPAAAVVKPQSGGQVQPPITPPKTSTLPPPLTPIPNEIVLNPGEAWEGDIPVSRILDLQARLNYGNVAGANFALAISVNGKPLAGPLLNKAAQFTYKDGRTFPYYSAEVPGWLVMYSPDFSANNGPAGGGYQVMTNPGEAYHYRWDLSAVAGAGPTMHVRIAHAALKAVGPLVIRITK